MAAVQSRRVQILENVTHFLTALVIFLKGLDKVDIPGKLFYGVIFIIIAVVIVLGTLFHHKAEKALHHFKGYVFALEAIVMAIVGYLYVKEGKALIQYVCFSASIMFLIALIVYIRKSRQTHV